MNRETDKRPELELRHLWYFLAVAEELSFSRAAVRIGIAQPPLSQQIRKLEQVVGCTLFDRTGRRVRLTPPGTMLVGEARRILADAAQTTERLRRIGKGEVGSVTIGFSPSTIFSPLPTAVRLFRERFPGVHVRLRETTLSNDVEALRAGTLDLAIEREPDPAEGIVAMPFLVEPFVAAVPADNPLAGRRSIRVAALRDQPFVLFPRENSPGLYRQVMELCRGAGFQPRVVQEAEAWHTIVSLVEAGIGVSLMPASFEGRRTGKLAYLALAGRPLYTSTMACARESGRSHAADAFLEVLKGAAADNRRPRSHPRPARRRKPGRGA